ncbi:hypothetical protein CC78DRAFT_544446 [Lojkania enalia]|uniref:DUF8035 domain-containing protein n=1 Tax=Lojkania enalia TaxID=147567 RepID=A0A9P4KAG8_9PLEO|nr:hypothetical protein CC78DRAFT_544446 [Didymosphaeria enalia]
MAYRASTGHLGFFDEPPRSGERWDRDRFERERSRIGRGRDEYDHFRFQEHDRLPGGRLDIDLHEDYDRRGHRTMERERFHEDERFNRPRHRHEVFDDDIPSEVANRALAPYRRKSIVEKDIDISVRRPTRPQYIRRQSSLDTFDRRPLPRYGDYERDEWRPPTNVPIPLPIRERRRSPSRPRHREEDFEDYRYSDREREPRREEYREVEIKREKSRRRARSRSRAARSIAATSARSSSTSSFEEVTEVSPVRNNVGRRGKTRMPKRLVKKQAIIELGYPYEEEDDFIIVKRALEKEHIDEIIKISENYREEKTTYVYGDRETVVEAAPPPPPPPPPPVEALPLPPPPASVKYPHSVRSVSPHHHGLIEERIEESNHINGPLTVLVPDERRVVRSERDIKDEIRALEEERRLLKYERESDYEIIERPRREVIRVEKDRRGRMALVRSSH